MRGLARFSVLAFLLASVPLHAENTLLTPVSGKTTSRREIHLVVKGPAAGLKLRSVETHERPLLLEKAPYKTGGMAAYHFRVHLHRGTNVLEIVPGRTRIVVKRGSPAIAGRSGGIPGFYLFHKAPAEAGCLPCHKGLGKGEGGGCRSCHVGKYTRPEAEWVHAPAAEGRCLSCHASERAPSGERFHPREGGTATLCFRCHLNARRWLSMPHVHGPVGAGNCVFCHDPHGSSHPFSLRYDGRKEMCLACHSEKAKAFLSQGFKPHAILAARGCTVCHDPHASAHPFQLEEPTVPLCVGCHPRFKGMTRGHPISRHPLQGKRDPLHPGRRFTCASCHDPHGSPYENLLIAPRETRLCSRCHPY